MKNGESTKSRLIIDLENTILGDQIEHDGEFIEGILTISYKGYI